MYADGRGLDSCAGFKKYTVLWMSVLRPKELCGYIYFRVYISDCFKMFKVMLYSVHLFERVGLVRAGFGLFHLLLYFEELVLKYHDQDPYNK